MPPKRKGGFFTQESRPEDELARQREVEALITTRHTYPQEIGVERIEPNPFQARREFPDIDTLAEAIRQQGFTSRLRVRPSPNRPGFFQLVYGERRLRAARQAGLREIPCDVADHTDEDLIEIGLAENIQRRDLDPLEEARAFQTFIEERGYSIRRLAERIGKDKSYVEDRLKLLSIPEDVQNMVAERPDALRAAREIAKISSAADRAPLILGVIDGSLSTSAIRERVRASAPSLRHEPIPHSPKYTIERDAHAIRAILKRWQVLATTEDGLSETIAEQAEALLVEFNQLVSALEHE